MTAVLLTCDSPYQRYCANTLAHAGVIESVVIEDGLSLWRERLTLRDMLSRIRAAVGNLRAGPLIGPRRACAQLANLLNHRTYYGDRDAHHRRILQHSYHEFDPRLRIIRVPTINDSRAIAHVRDTAPDLVFVHGTTLIRRAMLDSADAPFVNLHWGWSPDYRAEGIVPALALEGPQALGVTVHVIDDGVDSGRILYRARPIVDAEDNFYAIAIKLTVLGTGLFLNVAADLVRDGILDGIRQRIDPAQLYSGRRMRAHPEWYRQAWQNLRAHANAAQSH